MRRLALSVVMLIAAGSATAECRDDTVELRGPWGSARFSVELADTADERSQGLMNRPSLAPSAGMLFLYETPRPASFWMKNTLIPLDMLFVDPSGVVTRIHANAVPLDTTGIDGGNNVLAVLEVNGGLAQQLGINEGSELRHPRLDQALAVWPCTDP